MYAAKFGGKLVPLLKIKLLYEAFVGVLFLELSAVQISQAINFWVILFVKSIA